MHLDKVSLFDVGLIGSFYFLGGTIALFFVPRLGDIYGRKYIFFGCMVLQAVVYIWFLFATSIYGAITGMFISGISSVGRSSVGFVLLLEYLP